MPRLPVLLAAAALSAAAALTLAVPPVAGPVGAEHEVYYRFVVLGFVTDARGQPRRDQPVEVVRDKTGFSYLARPTARGYSW